MKLSVIVPVYNTEIIKLQKCFQSIKGLTSIGCKFECIIVDDGSLEKIGGFCKEFSKKNTCFKYFQKKNGGVSSARNFGIAKSSGDYICFVDSDDIMYINMNFKSVIEAMKNSIDIIFTDLKYYNGKNTEIWTAFNLPKGIIQIRSVVEKVCSDGKLNGPVCKFIRSEFIKNNSLYFNENMISGEDMLFLLNMLESKPSMLYIPYITYVYFCDAKTAHNRIIKDTELTINNNVDMYLELVDVIITLCNKDDILMAKATERYIKQLVNIASELFLARQYDFTNRKYIKKALSKEENILLAEKSKSYISWYSKVQCRVLKSSNNFGLGIYSYLRIIYLKCKNI